ncbi:uncharacterized protein LOC101215612 [Cucumis sativus]|uniref:Uncharacterized protein n=1 Tax=Cucumis sativus TaxID=3659 RepID=A0A0A0L055_CUCSA|nr:uncharacterized protein LOC101215612 [Cucumis sativus]KGN55118.1 hypothetical protein Csa_012887 [Cucumis sativus]
MAYSNRSVVAFRFSKALFEQCHGAAAAAAAVPPFSPAPAVSISYKVDTSEERDVTGAKAEELIAEMVKDGKVRSTVEVAYDATKGTAEKVKDTVIAEANENVVDTTEYRSMENMDDQKQ